GTIVLANAGVSSRLQAGDAFKAVIKLRQLLRVDVAVGDFDYGCAVIKKRIGGAGLEIKDAPEGYLQGKISNDEWAYIKANRLVLLRLMSEKDLWLFSKPFAPPEPAPDWTQIELSSSVQFDTTPHQVEESETAPDGSGVHFGIVISFFERDGDPYFILPQVTSLESIKRQRYTNWTLIAIGDGLQPDAIGRLFLALDTAGVPREKVIFQNMDESLRERNGLQDKPLYGCILWHFAGINAFNLGIELSIRFEQVTHIARLDDDDAWFPDHLGSLAKVYQHSQPQPEVVTTMSIARWDREMINDLKPSYHIVSHIPMPIIPEKDCMHAALSWSIMGKLKELRYRGPEEQHTAQVRVTSGDVDLMRQMASLGDTGLFTGLLVRRASTVYTTPDIKLWLMEKIRGIAIANDLAAFSADEEIRHYK
ncbi:unnamed protein product, partial [Chrysoparadoxa australica]